MRYINSLLLTYLLTYLNFFTTLTWLSIVHLSTSLCIQTLTGYISICSRITTTQLPAGRTRTTESRSGFGQSADAEPAAGCYQPLLRLHRRYYASTNSEHRPAHINERPATAHWRSSQTEPCGWLAPAAMTGKALRVGKSRWSKGRQ